MGKIVDTTLDVQRLKRNKKDVLKNGGKAGDEYTRVAHWLSKRSPMAIRTSLSRHRIEKRAERWWKMAGRREESEVARLAKRPPFFPSSSSLSLSLLKRENSIRACSPQNEPDVNAISRQTQSFLSLPFKTRNFENILTL